MEGLDGERCPACLTFLVSTGAETILIHFTFGLGMMAQVVVGRLYHGWVLLSIGGHGAPSDQVHNLELDEEGMGRVWCSSCPCSMGFP